MLERLLLLIVLLLASQAAVARAEPPLPINDRYCHQVTPIGAAPQRQDWRCGGAPRGYEDRRLWLSTEPSWQELGAEGATLLVHQTRMDRLVVLFSYADGQVVRHEVRAGDFGSYWRVGGQVAFTAPHRDAPLTSVSLGIALFPMEPPCGGLPFRIVFHSSR